MRAIIGADNRHLTQWTYRKGMHMPNLMDYVAWRGDLSFTASPFCAVDAMVLAQLAYIDFSQAVAQEPQSQGILLAEAARRLLSLPDADTRFGVMRDKNRALLSAISRSRRFGLSRLSGVSSVFDPRRAVQFAALCVTLPDGTACACFRGTDSTLAGWKEDLNMSYLCPVPAQELAAAYIARVAALSMPLRVLGHSKGGNLAVYAGAFCAPDVQSRILEIDSLDGPGLPLDRLSDAGYVAVKDRLHLLVPRTSIVGMLLAHDGAYTVVRSDAVLARQHSLYSWQVLGASPILEDAPDMASRYINAAIDEWLTTLSPEDRGRFIDALFELLTASGAATLQEFSARLTTGAPAMASAFAHLDAPSRAVLIEGVKRLASCALNAAVPLQGA